MIDIDKLKMFETELQVAIWKYTDSDAPQIIVSEMQEALNHISKALDILEWDEE
tara:strand:+ start:572 stop:733 length:162 start_codon:yes stop_codon:yes gene_type:complete